MNGRADENILASFVSAMAARGLEVRGSLKADGKLHRMPGVGGKKGDTAGYYVLHTSGPRPAGAFGCWRTGLKETWRADGVPLDAQERRRLKAQIDADRQRREKADAARKRAVAEDAGELWSRMRPAPADHPYLARKGIKPHGARIDDDNRIVVPLCDAAGKIWTLERIAEDGTKRFLPGGRKSGCFLLLGELAERIVIAEGFSTGATIHQATGLPVAVAFDRGNLQPVAKAIRKVDPNARIAIAADDDFAVKGNPGLTAARSAAAAVGGSVAVPAFKEAARRGTDFNDLAAAEGASVVAAIISAAFSARRQQGRFLFVEPGDGEKSPGVYREIEDKGDDGDVRRAWRWFCSQLEVVADTRDHGSEGWGRLLRTTDPDGRVHDWPMPMAMLAGDGTALRERLLDLGLRLAPGTAARHALVDYISMWRPEAKARCVDRVGWHGNAFVLPDRAYGDTAGEDVLLQVAGPSPVYATAGNIEGWRGEVARPAEGNSRLVFVISAAIAGPVLQLLGEESGGFHLAGWSSSGKTTALHAAASVWGVPVASWRATDNAGELMARGACDTVLPLDELGQADARTLDGFAYMLANGAGKARMKRDATGRPPPTWRLLFLSTGETGLAERLAEAGRRARAGQSVRVVEIPADAGEGHRLFEILHEWQDADALARHLRQAVDRHHGHAGRAFLELLTVDVAAARSRLAELRAGWRSLHLPVGSDGQVLRVAGRFALVAAAGELAIEAGILPWESGEANRAAAKCFKAWIAGRGGVGPADIRDGLAQVRGFLELHGSSRFEAAWHGRRDPGPAAAEDGGTAPGGLVELRTINRAGFRRAEAGEWDYYVLPEVWRGEVCRGFDAAALARHMIDREWMAKGEGKNLAAQQRVPGIGTLRVYHIRSRFLAGEDE